MKDIVKVIVIFATTSIFLSCNFNITDIPGPQISSTITSSRKHGAFICEYTFKGNNINGLRVESCFAEKKYSLSKGFFGTFHIDCCRSQVIISLKDDNTMITLNDIPQNWEIFGFRPLTSKVLVKEDNGSFFPDSITLVVRPNINESALEKLVLYKTRK